MARQKVSVDARHGLFIERTFNGRRSPRCVPEFLKPFEPSEAVERLERLERARVRESVVINVGRQQTTQVQ